MDERKKKRKRKEILLFCVLKKNTQKPNKWYPIQEEVTVTLLAA
jgi:hypothetical protein